MPTPFNKKRCADKIELITETVLVPREVSNTLVGYCRGVWGNCSIVMYAWTNPSGTITKIETTGPTYDVSSYPFEARTSCNVITKATLYYSPMGRATNDGDFVFHHQPGWGSLPNNNAHPYLFYDPLTGYLGGVSHGSTTAAKSFAYFTRYVNDSFISRTIVPDSSSAAASAAVLSNIAWVGAAQNRRLMVTRHLGPATITGPHTTGATIVSGEELTSFIVTAGAVSTIEYDEVTTTTELITPMFKNIQC